MSHAFELHDDDQVRPTVTRKVKSHLFPTAGLGRPAVSVCLALAAGLCIRPAFAEQANASMATVYVAASRSQTRIDDMPLHTTVVTQDQIRLSAAQTVDQLLRDIPGMNFTAVPAALSDPTGHQAKMRGLGNAKVLMLLDGVPLHDPFYLTAQWFKVPVSNIERVEVLRGANSSLWGNMAVAGVVNIVTKRPRTNGGQVQISAGSKGTWDLAVSRDIALGERMHLSLGANAFHTDGYQPTPEPYLYRFPGKQPTRADHRNLSLSLHARPNADLEGYLRLGYHVQDQQIGYRYGRNLQKSPDATLHIERRLAHRRRIEARLWTQDVRFDKFNGNTCYDQGGGTCLTSNSSALTPDKATASVIQFYTQQGIQRYRERGASLLVSSRPGTLFHGFVAGLDYRRLSATDTELFYNTPVDPAAPQGRYDSSTFGAGRQTFHGLFSQVKLAPWAALDLTVSARVDRYQIGQRSNVRTLANGISAGGALPPSSKTAFDPSVAARYALTDALSLRGAVYKAFRAPGFNNLTRTFGTGTSTTIANPDLVPENLRGWEAGADFRRSGLTLGATYFRYDIHDMIATFTARAGSAPQQVQLICGGAALPTCGGSARYYTNDQDGKSHGLELIAKWQPRPGLTLDGYATRTRSYLTRRGSVVTDPLGVQLAGVPKNVATIGMTWRDGPWRTRLQGRYTGPMWLDTTSSPGVRFGQGGFTVWDASADYQWTPAIAFFLRVNNLSNRRYGEGTYAVSQRHQQTLSPPRMLSGGLRARF
jgi:iron complex outermembrane receptor protein